MKGTVTHEPGMRCANKEGVSHTNHQTPPLQRAIGLREPLEVTHVSPIITAKNSYAMSET